MTGVRRLSRIDLICAEPRRLAHFYEALGFSCSEPVSAAGETRVRLRLGLERVDLVRPSRPGAPYPADVSGWNLAFQHFAIVVSDMRLAYDRLRLRDGWRAISLDGPVRLPEASGGVTAFKFRDPEGHPLELIAIPRRSADGPGVFRGIDHSAISVADTQRSVRFYESLGLTRTGGSLNRGAEQASLDGMAAPVVEVTALSPRAPTPHIELLSYRGDFVRDTPYPDANDIAATRLVLGETASTITRDPDGHLVVVEGTSPYSGST